MTKLADGARVEVQGSGANRYTLEHKGGVYSCSCPAWRNQTTRIERRTCKHLRAYLGDAVETARVGASSTPTRRPANERVRAPVHRRHVEDREQREDREAALATALSRLPALDDRMQGVYGLRLPRHLAYAIGWWMGLTAAERKEATSYVGNGPAGVGEWFLDEALERRLKPGLDERLHYRYRRDPPEMVTIFSGTSEGAHWGLWYDDPAKLPTAIVMNYARDSAETWLCKRTLLETLREDVAGRDEGWEADEWPHRAAVLAWLDEVLARELEAWNDERPTFATSGRPQEIVGGMASIDPSFVVPSELASNSAQRKRADAYKKKDPIVGEWIALAVTELEKGEPGRALFLGRELHWADADEWRSECTDLLVRAYEALDRRALAEIVKVHHANRGLPSVDVFEPDADPYSDKLGDLDALRAAIKKRPPTKKQLTSLLRQRTELPLLDVLLEAPAAAEVVESVSAEHVDEVQTLGRDVDDNPKLRAPLAAHRAAAIRLFERASARGKAFSAALATPDDAVRAAAIKHADLAWRSRRGRSALHVAARMGNVAAVDELLARGADPTVHDQDGKTPYDAAREAWQSSPTEASRIFELLTARGGGPPGPPKPVVVEGEDWPAGTAVKHSKFGDGVVESVSGTGDEMKLTIKFGSTLKTLVAKFVTRV